jgi:hypothetical protein
MISQLLSGSIETRFYFHWSIETIAIVGATPQPIPRGFTIHHGYEITFSVSFGLSPFAVVLGAAEAEGETQGPSPAVGVADRI